VGTATDWASITAGLYHTLAIKTDGTLWAWGANYNYQLGDGSGSPKYIPTQIGTASDWLQVSAGEGHTVAIKTNGTLWAWGLNNRGQVGDSTIADKHTPVQVGTSADWALISVGSEHSIALKTDGGLWAWGYDIWGQLGNNNTIDRIAPIPIDCLTFTSTGDAAEDLNNMSVYPNPASSTLVIRSLKGINTIEIFTMPGKKVFSQASYKQQTSATIDISKLQNGIYIIRLTSDNQTWYNQKILITR
jgi:alpha-tubulin suppressor-like RCC1 family protein